MGVVTVSVYNFHKKYQHIQSSQRQHDKKIFNNIQ